MSNLPRRYLAFVEKYPAIGKAHHELGESVGDARLLDDQTQELQAVTTPGLPKMMRGLSLVEDVLTRYGAEGGFSVQASDVTP